MTKPSTETNGDLLAMTTEIVCSYVGGSAGMIGPGSLPAIITGIYNALASLGAPIVSEPALPALAEFVPAVTARKSLASPDFIISMIDGKPYKTLTRHLTTNGLTPAEYRERYGLKASYPMTAPTYSEARRQMAKNIGLGRGTHKRG